MRRLAAILLMCLGLPVITLADESPSSPTSSATLRITLTVPERLQVTTAVVPDKRKHALCLTTDSVSVFAVSAVTHDETGWQLAALVPQSTHVASTDKCHAGQGLVYDLNPDRFANGGIVTLLLSPL